MSYRLLIVPTSGIVRTEGAPPRDEIEITRLENEEPDSSGWLRLKKAAELLADDQYDELVITGGRRPNWRPGFAEIYAYHFKARFPELSGLRRPIVHPFETNTNRDLCVTIRSLRGANVNIGWYDKFGVVSYPAHTERAAIVLRWLGCKNVEQHDSGEPQCYSDSGEWFLTTVTRIDPGWRWLGLPLVWESERRIAKV